MGQSKSANINCLSVSQIAMSIIPEELLQFKLPHDYIPGTDRISKIIARNQFTMDLLTASLLGVPPGTYTNGDSLFIDGSECDILYLPRSEVFASLPPVIVEIQRTVTREFMCRAVQYCLNVYNRFHILPVLFILCTSKFESRALKDLFKPLQNKPYLLETPCCHFAESCFMVTRQSIDPFIDSQESKVLDPLVAFTHFLTSGQQSIISIYRWDDPTITKLYLVAMEMVRNDRKAENDKIEALQTICQATQNQSEKIMTTVLNNPSQAQRYAEIGRDYSVSLKRKYDKMKEELNDSLSETTTPMELPKDFNSSSKPSVLKHGKLIAFVEQWKENNKGRMNWSACWEEWKRKCLSNEYSNSHSFKNIYHKSKRRS